MLSLIAPSMYLDCDWVAINCNSYNPSFFSGTVDSVKVSVRCSRVIIRTNRLFPKVRHRHSNNNSAILNGATFQIAVWFWLHSMADIPVAALGNCDPEALKVAELKFWLHCRGATGLSKLKTIADYVRQ